MRIIRWPPWKRASAETLLKWRQSKRNVNGIFHSIFFWPRWYSKCWKCTYNVICRQYTCCWVQLPHGRGLQWWMLSSTTLNDSSLLHYTLIDLSWCKFHGIVFFNVFFCLSRTYWFETRFSPGSKIVRMQAVRSFGSSTTSTVTLNFYFMILMTTMLPFNEK